MSTTTHNRRPLILAIEGNIGAGKTTLLNYLKKHIEHVNDLPYKVVFMREPVDVWQTICDTLGDSILSKFYREPEKYAFPFQIMAYTTRLSLIQKTVVDYSNCDIIICERSLEADKNVFARMLFMDGNIEDVNYQIYNHLYNITADTYKVDAVVYVDASPAICYERIHIRNREGEQGIKLDYLKRCCNYYNDWLLYGTNSGGKVNIHPLSNYIPTVLKEEEEGEKGEEEEEEGKKEEKEEINKYKNILKLLHDNNETHSVLHINANVNINYDNGEGMSLINKIMEFIQYTISTSSLSIEK